MMAKTKSSPCSKRLAASSRCHRILGVWFAMALWISLATVPAAASTGLDPRTPAMDPGETISVAPASWTDWLYDTLAHQAAWLLGGFDPDGSRFTDSGETTEEEVSAPPASSPTGSPTLPSKQGQE